MGLRAKARGPVVEVASTRFSHVGGPATELSDCPSSDRICSLYPGLRDRILPPYSANWLQLHNLAFPMTHIKTDEYRPITSAKNVLSM
eukprot:scaffold495129_cov33-Prasinocladus_malaysianus.AAC.1